MKNMKLWDWVVWNQRLKWKIIEYFMPSKKIIFFLCMYKMYLRVQKTGEIWPSMKDVGSGMGVKNISDLVLKEIHGILETKKTL